MANVPTPCLSSVDAAAAVAREAFFQAAPDFLSQSAEAASRASRAAAMATHAIHCEGTRIDGHGRPPAAPVAGASPEAQPAQVRGGVRRPLRRKRDQTFSLGVKIALIQAHERGAPYSVIASQGRSSTVPTSEVRRTLSWTSDCTSGFVCCQRGDRSESL